MSGGANAPKNFARIDENANEPVAKKAKLASFSNGSAAVKIWSSCQMNLVLNWTHRFCYYYYHCNLIYRIGKFCTVKYEKLANI